MKLLHRRQHLELLLEGSDGEEDVLLGHRHSGRKERLEVRLVLVLAETGDLTGGGHLDSENRVRSRETTEGELGDLDADVVGRKVHRGVRLDGDTEHNVRRHLDSVDAGDLGDEGEGPRRANVALDDLDLVVFGDELDVVGSGDVEGSSDLGGGLLDAANRLGVEVLRREDEGRVSRVNSGVLDVLGDVVHDHLSVTSDSVHLHKERASVLCSRSSPNARKLTSISFASSMYLETTTGCSRETLAAWLRYASRSSRE